MAGVGVWTSASIEKLREWQPHYSYGRIAEKLSETFGILFSRSAVIGKANRIGLKHAMGIEQKERSRTAPRSAETRKRIVIKKPIGRALVKLPPPEIVCEPISLLELTADSCRWPVSGEREHTMFCGANKIQDQPYCYRHWLKSIRTSETAD